MFSKLFINEQKIVAIVLLLLLPVFFNQECLAQKNNYLIGVGIYDITGQIAETNFFGYAELLHRNKGIRDRQYARAFIIQEPNGSPAVFVVIDKGGMFQSVNEAVMELLQENFGTLYNDDNVIISATHTHVAAGGFSHYNLYNTATGGYWRTNFNNLVEGIFNAIVRAHNNLAAGRIYYNKGELNDANINRSPEAYDLNIDKSKYDTNIDNEMKVLKFIQGDKEVGMISWFAVHPTSLSNNYEHNSSDNKGYAALKFERLKKSTYDETGSFVAAFANTNAGDMSPNLNMPPEDEIYQDATGPGKNEEESANIIGIRQYDKALSLYNSANLQLTGSIKVVSRYNDFSNISIDPKFTNGIRQNTCRAALGESFKAGAEDGRSGISREGITKDSSGCHAEKPIAPFFYVGNNDANPATPKILPITLMKIGQLGILAVPAEFTVMSGRRVQATVMSVNGTGITETVFAGYSDAYAGYVTTREEYKSQQYEGASTHFGPWTLAAYRQEFERLAIKLVDPSSNPWPYAEPTVPNKTAPSDATVTVIKDGVPSGVKFGDLKMDVESFYTKGSKVKVIFWGAHPNNDLKTNSTYLSIERWNGNEWEIEYEDRDPVTKLTWSRIGTDRSHITIEWNIPEDAQAGYYRILHSGKWKRSGRLTDYSGLSRSFYVE